MRQSAQSSMADAEAVRPGGNAEPTGDDVAGRVPHPDPKGDEDIEKVLVSRARRLGLVFMILSALVSLALLWALWLGLSGAL